jgi:hypothetical protein
MQKWQDFRGSKDFVSAIFEFVKVSTRDEWSNIRSTVCIGDRWVLFVSWTMDITDTQTESFCFGNFLTCQVPNELCMSGPILGYLSINGYPGVHLEVDTIM